MYKLVDVYYKDKDGNELTSKEDIEIDIKNKFKKMINNLNFDELIELNNITMQFQCNIHNKRRLI